MLSMLLEGFLNIPFVKFPDFSTKRYIYIYIYIYRERERERERERVQKYGIRLWCNVEEQVIPYKISGLMQRSMRNICASNRHLIAFQGVVLG